MDLINFILFLVKQRFAWRIRDYSNLGSLLTEYMKEKVGSAHAAPKPNSWCPWKLDLKNQLLVPRQHLRVKATFESLLRG